MLEVQLGTANPNTKVSNEAYNQPRRDACQCRVSLILSTMGLALLLYITHAVKQGWEV